MTSQTRWLLEILKEELPHSICLFGSAAAGQMTESSDLDFAIGYASRAGLEWPKEKVYQAKRDDDVPLDFLFYTQDELELRGKIGGVAYLILREGRIVYPRQDGKL